MKILFAALAAAALSLSAQSVFELFDTPKFIGKAQEGTSFAPSCGQDGLGALKLTGNGKAVQYCYRYRFPVMPGKEYGVSFAACGSEQCKSVLAMLCFYKAEGKLDAKSTKYFPAYLRKGYWNHHQYTFTIPEGAAAAELVLRLSKVPAGGSALIDNLRVAELNEKDNFFFARKLETIFDNWTFLGQQHFENYLFGPGGKIMQEWKHAKVGESFFQANGDNSKMQYPLTIVNLKLKENCNYTFRCFLKASAELDGKLAFFMFSLRDEKNRELTQPRYRIKPTGNEWLEVNFSLKTPPKCVKGEIWLNMRNVPQAGFVAIDHLRFAEAATEAALIARIDPAQEELFVQCALPGGSDPAACKDLKWQIRSEKDNFFREIPGKAEGEQSIALKDFSDGNYQLTMAYTGQDGRRKVTPAWRFAVCRKPYWRNDFGVIRNADPAPAPWQDLSRRGNVITFWNGKIDFSQGVPGQIASSAMPEGLFARGVSVELDGVKIAPPAVAAWKDGKSRCTAEMPFRGAKWQGKCTVTADYMGFLRYSIELAAQEDCTIRHGQVDFQLKQVEFLHRSDTSWTDIGAVDLSVKKSWESKHAYSELMFGTVDGGVALHAPQLYPAQADFSAPAIRAAQNGEFSIQLVNAPLTLKKGERFHFDFAVSTFPWRPAQNYWQRLRFRAGKYSNFQVNTGAQIMTYCGLPASCDDEGTQKYLARQKGLVVNYQIPFFITNTMPEWRYFESVWRTAPARSYNLGKHFGNNVKMERCDTTDQLWKELYVYMVHDYLAKFPWGGFYFDCYNADVQFQKGKVFHPTFETRDFHERIFKTMHDVRKDAFTITHLGSCQGCTSAGFSDVVLMGEQYRAQCAQHTYYLEFLTLNEFRFENAVNIGPDRMFLPQYRQKYKSDDPKVACHVLGLALLHKQMLYPNFIEPKTCQRVRDKLFDFGIEKAEFFPYWKPDNGGVKTGTPAVVSSRFRNEKGSFAVVLNQTGKPVTFQAEFGEKFTRGEVYDPVAAKSIPFTQGMTLELPPYLALFLRLNR